MDRKEGKRDKKSNPRKKMTSPFSGGPVASLWWGDAGAGMESGRRVQVTRNSTRG